jgi:urease accessory protein
LDACTSKTSAKAGWQGRLELDFEQRGPRTVLARARHYGPLRVQRAFYPEPDGTCHAYVLHPPGGVVGGDRLNLDVVATGGARTLLTTPAATKFYRSAGREARQVQHLRVDQGCRLEWLPEESIVYDGAEITLQTRVALETGAELMLWDILCLGRPACGERFDRGCVRQGLEISRDGVPLLLERACYEGGGDALRQPYGLGGQPVVGTFVCVSTRGSEAVAAEARDALYAVAGRETACTLLPGALVCRYLGPSTERAQRALRAAWSVLRVRCFGVEAVAPRIWAT